VTPDELELCFVSNRDGTSTLYRATRASPFGPPVIVDAPADLGLDYTVRRATTSNNGWVSWVSPTGATSRSKPGDIDIHLATRKPA